MTRTVLSLTSVPPRFAALGPVLESLLAQRADAVELWLPRAYLRFPDWDGGLPQVPGGVTLRRADGDLGPATKCLPALAVCGPGDRLVICDDDMIYGSGWLDGLRTLAVAHPGAALAVSSFPVGRLALDPRPPPHHLVAQGFAGVSIPGGRLSPPPPGPRDRMVDDIWLSAHLAAADVPILPAPGLRALVRPHGPADVAALQDAAPGGLGRAQANLRSARALRRELSVWD